MSAPSLLSRGNTDGKETFPRNIANRIPRSAFCLQRCLSYDSVLLLLHVFADLIVATASACDLLFVC